MERADRRTRRLPPDDAAAQAAPPPGGRFERGAAAAGAALVAFLLVPGVPAVLDAVVSGTAWTAAAAFAAHQCLRRSDIRARGGRPWRLLAAGAAAWAVGCAGWTVLHVVSAGAPPFPTPADIGFLLFPPLATVGLLQLPGLPAARTARARLLLDGAVLTTALLVVAWIAGMAQVPGESPPLAVAGRLAFLSLDVLAASVALLVLSRVRPGSLPAVRRAAAGVLVVVMSDVGYSAVASSTGYLAGGVPDAAWFAGFLVLASAARTRSGAIDDPRPGTRLVPAAPAALAGAALLGSGRLVTGLDGVLTGLLVGLAAALTARQVLLGVENAALHRSLEAKVTERTWQLQAAVEEARLRARTDPLTGLPNREGFVDAVAEQLAGTGEQARTAVVVLDLDRFQEVNDGLGHDVGDTVLVAAAERLAGGLRAGQVLCRLGGDEFGVLLTHLRSDAHARAVADRLVARLRSPLSLGGLEVAVGASAGIAVRREPAPAGTTDRAVRDLLRDADTALLAAKAEGGGGVREFLPEMHLAVRRSLQLQGDLRTALAHRQLTVHYQPVVDLVADRVVGVEALARWTHPVQGPVPPLAFIAAAERSGLVVELERLVLDTACAQLARWRRTAPGLTVAVNVSARHLRERDYLETMMTTLHRHALPPAALVLEVTESLLFHDDDQVREVLEQLHTAGVGLALDDFGTGYSSLSRLVDYPFDTLKVDRSFVSGLEGPSGVAVLTATLAMARGLGLRVVAEGVETGEQLRFLTDAGCELAQGYLLSRPGPAETVGPVLSQRLLPRPRQAR